MKTRFTSISFRNFQLENKWVKKNRRKDTGNHDQGCAPVNSSQMQIEEEVY